MTYYKIIRGGNAIDAGCVFLRWDARHRCLMACEPRDAHYVQSYDGTTVYRVGWLNPLPDGAPMYRVVEAKIIDESEYADLIEVLPDGETVPEPDDPEPSPDPEPEPSPDPEPEHRMTVQEMREKITEQEETITMLTECLLEMSEIVYGGELA